MTLALVIVALALAVLVAERQRRVTSLRRELERRPALDSVTGLPARAQFLAGLATRLTSGARIVALAEVRDLRDVNGTLGHSAGDRLLAATAQRLWCAAGGDGSVGRLGNGEFGLVLPAGPEPGALGRALMDALTEPVAVGDRTVRPAVRVGLYPATVGEAAEAVLSRAELALVAARAASAGWEVYEERRHAALRARRQLAVDLSGAAARGELVLHYQPVVDLRDNRLVGAEALLRWRRSGELLMPGAFIREAEESGAITEMGMWVLGDACREVARWNERYRRDEPLEVGVNVSVRQLDNPRLAGELAEVIARAGIDPRVVNLEITESSIMDNVEEMIRRLEELKAVGVTLSMDDFGTGYSSLSSLRQLPVDILKIDRSFVSGIASQDEEWAVAVAIVRLATSLGKRTLAEGIESPAQLAHLRALHCELGQGYLFSVPLAADEFEELLASGRPLQGSNR